MDVACSSIHAGGRHGPGLCFGADLAFAFPHDDVGPGRPRGRFAGLGGIGTIALGDGVAVLLHGSVVIFLVDEDGPGVLEDGLDGDAAFDIAVEHFADEVDAVFGQDVWDAEVVVHDLVDGVEGIFFVDDRV